MDSSDEEDDCPVMLGFVNKVEDGSPRLQSHHFPSKAWLEPAHLPAAELLRCGDSGQQLKFLLQVYAPVDGVQTAFHRTIFVFISPEDIKRQSPGAVRAFRSQLPRANAFYSYEPADDAAAVSTSGAGRGSATIAGWSDAAPFPEWELGIEEEPDADSAELRAADSPGRRCPPSADEAVSMQESNDDGAQAEEEEGGDDDLADFDESAEHAHFSAFSARVARAPAQCLRYCFEDGEEPLWPARQRVPTPGSVPACTRCGAARRFEFQVMPQLLNYIDVPADDDSGLDFGTIAIYSCSESCALEVHPQTGAYAEEFVFVQQHA